MEKDLSNGRSLFLKALMTIPDGIKQEDHILNG